EPASTSRRDRLRPSRRRALTSSSAAMRAMSGSVGMANFSVKGRRARLSKSVLRIGGLSEIVPRIGAVEGFVADREISDDVAFDRGLKQRPLEPGWIAQMAAFDAASSVDPDPGKNVAAK